MKNVTPLLNYVVECNDCGGNEFFVSVDGFKGKISQILGFECTECEGFIPLIQDVEEGDENDLREYQREYKRQQRKAKKKKT
jgi:hypothetical protein